MRYVLPLVLLLLAPTALLAQEEVGVGGGEDINIPVSPGLEQNTPGSLVELYEPYDDQVVGRVTIPDDKLGVLVQPEGRTWRAFRIQGLYYTAMTVILLTIALLGGFYLWRGTIKLESGRSGRWVPRFGSIERFAHWTTAISFLTLALTGLTVTFGRYLLIPILGHYTYTPLATAAKSLHNWSAIPFVIGLVLMLAVWIKDNIPSRADWLWIKKAGGMFERTGSFHPETARFNAGQKIIFWSVILGGTTLAISGYFLMAPFYFTGVSGMQIGHVIHSLSAVVMIAVILCHIYIGTLGMEGAFDAIGRGKVDENWAIEHHHGWYKAQVENGSTPVEQGTPPATDGANPT
ncbi:formate dehydrogenase subunit gamma [Palleronia sp.]|uniref:formate dehydrogenase subunit gamma n=1 Tax=Palleronia sp. TaxID=1940284 RepID=UPI0035C7CE4B